MHSESGAIYLTMTFTLMGDAFYRRFDAPNYIPIIRSSVFIMKPLIIVHNEHACTYYHTLSGRTQVILVGALTALRVYDKGANAQHKTTVDPCAYSVVLCEYNIR